VNIRKTSYFLGAFARCVFSLALALCIVVMAANAASAGDLIASYRFDTNGADSLGRSPSFVLTNGPTPGVPAAFVVTSPPFTNGVLYLNGLYDPNGHRAHYLGTAPIQDLRYDSFTFSLDFYPLPRKRTRYDLNKLETRINNLTHDRYLKLRGINPSTASFNQDVILNGGFSYRWIGFNRESGLLNLTLNNHSFTHQYKGVRVKPGRWHNLICSVDLRSKEIVTMFDGRPLEVIQLPPDFKLEVMGSPEEANDREFTFVDGSNGSVVYAYAANLKIFGRNLNSSELPALYSASLSERPRFPRSTSNFLPIFAIVLIAFSLIAGLFLLGRRRHVTGLHQDPLHKSGI